MTTESPQVTLDGLRFTVDGEAIASFSVGYPGGAGPASMTIEVRVLYDPSDRVAELHQRAFEATAHWLELAATAVPRIRGH